MDQLSKAMEAGCVTGRETANQPSTQEALKQESIDGVKPKKKKDYKKLLARLRKRRGDKVDENISKGKILNEIFSMFNFDTIQDAKRLYELAEKIQKNLTPDMEVVKVSPEALQKAQEVLGLIEKEETTAAATETPAAELTPEQVELKKAEDDMIALQAKIENLKNPKKVETPAATAPAALNEEIVKAFDNKIGALATVIQSKDEKIEELSKAISEITAFNQELGKKIGMIERTPMGRKSVTTERYIEKGGEAAGASQGNEGVRVMSISNPKHRAAIADVLFKAATKVPGEVDNELSKACSYVELGQISAELNQMLRNDFKIQVTK